ncbi:unnamed protein product [Brassicogethes aeneus]|uniref:Uncharacterized protein n=1 Tax=Brassicogethes aeneus TaxID=1431903 RepID=A0A9P0B7V3_BRAAE|nr:unnamed protein product [Brassicogethes aeneus]
MQCPEVWNFKEPESTFKSQIVDANGLSNLNKIKNFYYNHLASIILPDTLRVPKTLTETLNTDCDYYSIKNINLQDLLDCNFLVCFVRSGTLTLLSVNTRIDCDTCVCITPTGHLILNVDKETFQTLGLEGKVSHFHSKVKSRYFIDIDLTKENFLPGNPFYERVKFSLSKLPDISIVLTWKPPKDEICPSSIANHLSKKYTVKQCSLKHDTQIVYSVKVPDINLENCNEEDIVDFVEWLGMVALDVNFDDFVDDHHKEYLNSYQTPTPNIHTGQVRVLQWRGMFTFNAVEQLIEEARKYIKSEGKPWAAIYVQGFSDSPVAWSNNEHHYFMSGDNGYIIIIKDDKFAVCTNECSKKKYK